MAVRRYRGGKLKRPSYMKDIPVTDAPVEQDEVVRLAGSAVPLMERYVAKARKGLRGRPRGRDTVNNRNRLLVWQHWCAGYSPAKIAISLNLDAVVVDNHIRYYRDCMEEGLRAIPVVTGAELILHYQNLYHESMDAWRASRLDRQRNSLTRRERTTTTPDGPESMTEQNSQLTREGQTGDPRLLERAMAALDRIAVLQGIARPGSLNGNGQPRQVDATEVQAAGAHVPRVQLYLPHNGRDDHDGTLADAPILPEQVDTN